MYLAALSPESKPLTLRLPLARRVLQGLTRHLAGLALCGWASGAALAAPPLLSPAELSALLKDPVRAEQLRIVDIRDPKTYATQHLPEAQNAPYAQWRGPTSNPGELPPLPKLTALVQQLGLSPQTHAVVVSSGADASDFGAAARVYWTLKVLGLKELSVLNGGVKAWTQAGLPLGTKGSTVLPSDYAPTLDKSLIATREEVRAAIDSGKSRLVDARPAEFFSGQTRHAAAAVPGTLKGAVNLTHDSWFVPGTATFVGTDKARQIAASLPAAPGSSAADTVSFCNTGHWAATNWFALSEVAGQKDVKLYAGSLVEWTRDAPLETLANVPGRLQQLAINAKLWADRTFK
jgi:thiosulfate/3-mercaptopyruvate sulfurtransferase